MPLAEVENKDGWMLYSLNLNHHSWDKDTPYHGKITFHNRKEDSLSFNIPPDKMNALLALVSDSVIDSATRLGHRIAASVTETLNQMQPALPASQELVESEPKSFPF